MSARNQPTGWVGWVYFASLMMMLVGGFQAISGLVALFKDDFYLVTEKSLLVFDYSTWGWVHLIMGIVIFAAGVALMNGAAWARMVGILLAGLSLFANMAFLSAFPLWSILMIVVDVLVIYALTVHGDEVRE
ncbi:hypothetical protein A3E49_03190 [Candidatus Saccharibacteria bacterium RIFCSPHIGHO2_12_FULL_49_19]|nr:MAG: hypothetical protein A2708_02770 [Candidatus Saccharibacteria bacterium RIFCSPHIGHO2_01_FULL_49_21]OGL37078.1 MAG: hypothetical protein A3E49_03190 [Candidatus Saccharibacteria bacterium RIFCSPHIGHO2_12_FULL_49_19]OGL37710.1 MAG: hypothetical protein A3B63_00595 [Candidatus Saccharibacteria bacterium RIFCSPLOWO2_01_FULL_49_22]